MAGLRDMVQALAARADVDAVVVLSGDGLPIDSAGILDAEAVAALAATFAQGANRLGQAAECAELNASVLEFADRLAIVRRLGREGHLFVLAPKATNIGPLLLDLRRQAPELDAIL